MPSFLARWGLVCNVTCLTGNLSQKLHNVHNRPRYTIKKCNQKDLLPFFPKTCKCDYAKNLPKKKEFSQNKENPDINCSQNTKEKVNKQVIKLFLETHF